MSAGAPVHAHALTAGGILQLIESEGHFSGPLAPPPTLQIINIRRVPANALTDVYWAVLSDGDNSIEVVISTHLSHLVQSGQLAEHTILRVNAWQYNITDDNIHIVSIGVVDVLEDGGDVIGDPTESAILAVLDGARRGSAGGDEDGLAYFGADDDEWDYDEGDEGSPPLTWSCDDGEGRGDGPSDFSDWTIRVTRLPPPPPRDRGGGDRGGGGGGGDAPPRKREAKRPAAAEGKAGGTTGHPAKTSYYVHKAILSAGSRRSEYFTTLFKQSHLAEFATNTSHINLEDSAARAFPGILDYIYNDKKIKFSSKNATAIRHLAHYFGIRSLWKCASAFIRGDFSVDTAAVYLTEAVQYHDEKLEHASINILAERLEEVHRRTLAKLAPASFERIVSSPKLKCRSKKLSDIVLKYCQTQGDAVDMSLLMKFTRCEVMPSVSRKSALPLLKVALAEEKKAGVNLSDAHTVRARCVETCVEEWKETLAKPLLALESRDQNISRILGAYAIQHRDLPLEVQVELLEKALCAAKVELDDVKAELLYREEQVEKLTDQVEKISKNPE